MACYSRRSVLTSAAAAVGALACRGPDEAAPPAQVRRPRNLVLITADDLGWKDVGALGASVDTPALDRLVAEGVSFDNAFDVVSTCSSSRASIATGQYPHTHGVLGLVHRLPELSLPPEHPTLMTHLARAGLYTAIQGKWHLNGEEPPDPLWFVRFLPTDLDQLIRDGTAVRTFLEARGEQPFYLELNYMQTHRDLFGAFQQAEGFEVSEDLAAPPAYWALPDVPGLRTEVAAYLSQLRWMDALIGELLADLERLDLAQDTLVAFVSDNGPAFPGCKLSTHDRGIGTPLMFWWPGGLEPARHASLVTTIDLAPTLLELVGADPLPGAEGRSLAPLLRGEPFAEAEAVFAEMEQHGGGAGYPTRSVRTRTLRYLRNYSDHAFGPGGAGDADWVLQIQDLEGMDWSRPRVPEELYDLETDPTERMNLVGDPAWAQTLDELRAVLDDHLEATGDFRLGSGFETGVADG